jgi:MFS family permease
VTKSWNAVFVLLVMYMISYLDRQIIAMMVAPLQRDLNLTDVEIGLLQGFAFSLLYILSGIFLGWFVDRYSRRLLIMGGVIFWSVSCALCGLANGFATLFAARVGVGIGEATLATAVPSMLSDLFPREKLTLALGMVAVGGSIGITSSFILGGALTTMLGAGHTLTVPLLGELRAWQATFLILGLPGIAMAFLMLTIREPPRTGRLQAGHVPFAHLMAFLATRRHFITCHFLGFSLNLVAGYGLLAWLPTLLARRFAWQPMAIGPAVGLVVGSGGIVGPLLSGALADVLLRRGVRDAHFRIQMVGMCFAAPIAITTLQSSSPIVVLIGAGAIYLTISFAVPLSIAPLQLITPNELRGRLTSLFTFVSSLIGVGCGPLLVALLTDRVFQDHMAVGRSLLVTVSVSTVGCAVMMAIGRPAYQKAMAEADLAFAHSPSVPDREKKVALPELIG